MVFSVLMYLLKKLGKKKSMLKIMQMNYFSVCFLYNVNLENWGLMQKKICLLNIWN